jgi:hypothetical protein
MEKGKWLSGRTVFIHYILLFSAVFIMLFSAIVQAQKYQNGCEQIRKSSGEFYCADGLDPPSATNDLAVLTQKEKMLLSPVVVLPLKHLWKKKDVAVGLKNINEHELEFELHHRAEIGQSFRKIEKPCFDFSYRGDIVFLDLSLLQTGLYHIRFRKNEQTEWGRWQSFLVMSEVDRLASISGQAGKLPAE